MLNFACAEITGDFLMDPFWEAIFRLEKNQFKVMANSLIIHVTPRDNTIVVSTVLKLNIVISH